MTKQEKEFLSLCRNYLVMSWALKILADETALMRKSLLSPDKASRLDVQELSDNLRIQAVADAEKVVDEWEENA